MTEEKSKFWLDIAVAEIVQKYPEGKITVSSGISPSASYHIGHFREILTADALTWGLREVGREAEHLHVVDNFDPLRKRYPFLPEWLDKHVGQPICLIPDPMGDCHKTYADHFFSEFEQHFEQMGIQPHKIIKGYEDLYRSGSMAKYFEMTLESLPQIHTIFKRISNRELEKDWTPVQVLDDENRFFNADIKTWNKDSQTIAGKSYADGHAKLNWRLDWPARWAYLNVKVEPFGIQEHGAAGGSYETGAAFCKEVFKHDPPMPSGAYAAIHLPGDNKKMSSSLGNLITPGEALEILPPEVMRYFIIKSRPERKIFFDPGLGLYNLIDEYSKVKSAFEHGLTTEFAEAYKFASVVNRNTIDAETISTVPFSHLVSAYQTANGEPAVIHSILKRTGYDPQNIRGLFPVVEREIKYVKNWLAKYAPDSVKFTVQKELPKADLSANQKVFLAGLAKEVEGTKGEPDGQAIHETIYKLSEQHQLKPAEAFQAIYRVILAQDQGPKAGWFLSSLDKNWLVKRLKLES